MLIELFLQARAERLIAVGRTVIAIFAIAAVWVDPVRPAGPPLAIYALLGFYVSAALAVLLLSRRRFGWTAQLGLASHILDLAVFSLVILLTERPNSPFFLLFAFPLLASMFRWHWRGALWTSVAVMTILLLSALIPPIVFARHLDPDRLIVRMAFVLVVGAMLVYFGFHQQRLANEAVALAGWQPDLRMESDIRSFLSACGRRIAELVASPRILLISEDPDEPSAVAYIWEDGMSREERLPSDFLFGGVDPALSEVAFIRHASGETVVLSKHGTMTPWQGAAICPSLAKSFAIDEVLSVPISGDSLLARLFVMASGNLSSEKLPLMLILVGQISLGLERLQAVDALRRSAIAEERLALARDLHDGALQSLAGTALQLEALARMLERDPHGARARIAELQEGLLVEQRTFRSFIQKLRPGSKDAAGTDEPDTMLPAVARNLARQWGMKITLQADLDDLQLPEELEFHLLQILREAAANAARHGGATELKVEIETGKDIMQVSLVDDGCGLSIHGHFDQDQAAERRLGPRSLRERVISLGGWFEMQSGPGGLTLSISLPLQELQRAT